MVLAARDWKIYSRFDRFGLITTWIDGNARLVYFDPAYTCGH